MNPVELDTAFNGNSGFVTYHEAVELMSMQSRAVSVIDDRIYYAIKYAVHKSMCSLYADLYRPTRTPTHLSTMETQ